MQAIYDEYRKLHGVVLQEAKQRSDIQASTAYTDLETQIQALELRRDALLAELPDSRPKLEDAKRLLIDAMKQQQVTSFGNVVAKMREKKEVNTRKVLDVLGGDMDQYFSISTVTQVALKDLAKTMPILKNELMDCVEVIGKEIVDLEIVQ